MFLVMTPKRITVHCSATKNGEFLDIDVIRGWHKAKGWQDVGYHLIIEPDGEVQHGRPLNVQGAHVEDENKENVGICLIGTDKYKLKQLDALRYQIDSLVQIFNIQKHEIYTHNYFDSARKQKKACPSFSTPELLNWYLTGNLKALEKNILKEV